MASIDPYVFDHIVSIGAPSVTRAGFGVVMIVASASNLDAGFVERVRTYTSAADVSGDGDLGAATTARLSAIFALSRAPSQVKVGRREADQAQVNTYTVTGNTDGDYTITINGVDYTFSASSNTVEEIRDALVSAINGGSEPVTAAAGVPTDELTVTADEAGTAFTSATSSTGDDITTAETTANRSAATELDAIVASDADFFHVVLDTRDDTDIARVASWASTNKRMFWAQTSSADVAQSGSSDVYSTIISASNRWVVPSFYTDDGVYFDAAWAGYFAASDFDSEAPTAAFNTLTGIVEDTALTSSQIAILKSKGINFYSNLKGIAATSDAHTCLTGKDVELVVTAAWAQARIDEAIAQLFLNVSNAGGRIRFNDRGFAQIDGEALQVLKGGETTGHFNAETAEIDGTARADVSPADESSGTYRFNWGAQYSGRVKDTVIRGYVTIDFEGF